MTFLANKQQKLHKELDIAWVVAAKAWKETKEEVGLLRDSKLTNEALQAKIQSLKLDNASLGSVKAKVKEESTRLKLELEQVQVDFFKEMKDVKAMDHKQEDDMFFYGYNYCMRKHEIIDDISSISSNDKVEPNEEVPVLDDRDT